MVIFQGIDRILIDCIWTMNTDLLPPPWNNGAVCDSGGDYMAIYRTMNCGNDPV